jgi:hypothetical protein
MFSKLKIGVITISLLAAALMWAPLADAAPKDKPSGGDKSDLNSDGRVDFEDLILFSTNYLQKNVVTVDWCQFYEDTTSGTVYDGHATIYFKQHFRLMLGFINSEFSCDVDAYLLDLENDPIHLLRIT